MPRSKTHADKGEIGSRRKTDDWGTEGCEISNERLEERGRRGIEGITKRQEGMLMIREELLHRE